VRLNLSDAVAQSLREAMLSGELHPGERLLQDQLAAELGVSRAPVRDAMQRLQTEGLLIEQANGGIVVREFTHEDLCENYLLRGVLEGEVTRIASLTMTDAAIDELESVNVELRRAALADKPRLVLDLNDQFHFLIRESAGERTLNEFISTLWTRMAIKTRVLMPGRAAHSPVEHAAIIATLRSRAPAEAFEAAQAHVETACREYLDTTGLSATPALEGWLSRRESLRSTEDDDGSR
jgi:DNA-binding GntR family transcriptional regulator